ncbi:hypothetical protein GTP91_25300 [Rugamonas sp. FT82W]|uniref:Uncharacterized protein n=1 Tax=Duganella vulcania TaxID=2692166 RepID=A0A845GB60_9BURK|nr:hypothetical protein [Duganella vulcania]MYM90476.1 hypothetical protein [Duganella vulcania]
MDQQEVITRRKQHFEASFYERQLAAALQERSTVFSDLSSHAIYASLSDPMREKVRNGEWRIEANKALGWNALAKYTTLPKHWAASQYYLLSIYAHAGYQSIRYESTHNQDVPGLLMHLYIVAAYFIRLFDKRVATTDIQFSDREVAIIQEMIFMSQQTDLVVGENGQSFVS